MPKNLFFFFCMIGFLFVLTPANAQVGKCTKLDQREMRLLDKKAARVREKIVELSEEFYEGMSAEDTEDLGDQIEEEKKFFESPEYLSKKGIYDRCGREMPKLSDGFSLFWMPTAN